MIIDNEGVKIPATISSLFGFFGKLVHKVIIEPENKLRVKRQQNIKIPIPVEGTD